MKRLLRRAALFALPFFLLTVFVGVVDPFNCLGYASFIGNSVKLATAEPLHNPLWKVSMFMRSPVSRLILGDSSMASINTDEIRSITGTEYFNFAYGGGTLSEAADTYWFAAGKIHLDAVYLGIGFINFNEYQNLNRVPEAQAMVSSPLKYLTNRIVLGAAFIAAYAALTGKPVNLGVPRISREAFWHEQIDESLPQLLHEYRYPGAIAAKLTKIAVDCRKHGTRLVIVIPPTHTDLQAKIATLGRTEDEERFKAFVRTLGTVVDLDYPNAFTADRTHFSDPFHTTTDDMLIREVWGTGKEFSRHTPHL